MFEFWKKTDAEVQSYLDIIATDMTKIQLSKLAMAKAKAMIAKAIAKSEFILLNKDGRIKNGNYYRLNIEPNDFQTGTDFWIKVVEKLLDGECVIVRHNGKYYIADSYQETNEILYGKTYRDVAISDGHNSIKLTRPFRSADVMHLKYPNAEIRTHTQNVLNLYNEALTAMQNLQIIANTPRFKLKIAAQMSFRKKNADGTEKVLTADQYIEELVGKLKSSDMEIIKEAEGVNLEFFNIESKITADEITKMAKEINSQCAMAYDIPQTVFFGNITEKSDATNEFITYAVGPVAEIINDSLNAKLVGLDDYTKGEQIHIWLARFKHVDVVDSAASLDKLRGIGFSYDEIREMVGYEVLNTEFSTKRAMTKNYSSELEETSSELSVK